MTWEMGANEYDEKRDLERWPAWFSDEVHYTPIRAPFTIMNHQESQTQGMTWANEHLSHPTCKGWDWRLLDGIGYVTTVPVTDPKELEQRSAKFREVLKPIIEDYPKVWGGFRTELEGYWNKVAAVDMTKLSNVDLLGHMRELLSLDMRVQEIHYFLMEAAYSPYILFEQLAKELLGIDDTHPTFHKLMAGFPNRTFEADKWLWQLGQKVIETKLGNVFTSSKAAEVAPQLEGSEAGRKWLGELREYLNVFGKRMQALHDTDLPSWEEDVSVPILRVQGYLKTPTFKLDEERERRARERAETEKEVLAKVPSEQRQWFAALLRCAQNSSSYSEEHEWWMNDISDTYLRYCALETGKRMVQADAFDEVDDVFYLTVREVLQYGYHPYVCNLRSLVDARKALREEWKRRPHPPVLCREGMSMDEAFGFAMQAQDPILVKLVAGTLPTPNLELKADIYGTCGAPGTAEGPARVVMSDDQFDEIQPGDILVAPCTYVTWTAVFGLLSGVVVDRGGSLSHAAICSREHGIPCILNTFVGTSTIKSGQRIRINAEDGAIYILDK